LQNQTLNISYDVILVTSSLLRHQTNVTTIFHFTTPVLTIQITSKNKYRSREMGRCKRIYTKN